MPPPGQVQRKDSKFIVFEQFEKMNTQSVRQALSEKELAWLENLQPIAPNNLTTVPALGPQLTAISETIYKQFYANIGTVDYIISFTTAGSGWATNIATAVSVEFAPPTTFTNPDMTVWQSQYIIINDPNSAYAAWNGTVFVKQGGISPNLVLLTSGSGYTSTPTVTISGGSGTGATATATFGTPGVASVSVITGGTQYGPAPTVVFSGGGGTGAAATATIDPRLVSSITLTFQGQYLDGTHPIVNFSGGGGSGASASVVMVASGTGFFVVQSITLLTAGSGYTSAPTVTFTGGNPFGAGQATATCTVSDGRVRFISVTNPGSGYTSAPAVSFSGGGSGSGASAAATLGGGGVTSLTLTNPGAGYLASDTITVTIAAPGGGVAATASGHVWPFATPGTTLAVFAGRVWLGNKRQLIWTGTQGFDDFNVANAAGTLTIGDADLTHSITALRNYNNYLFIMGDQSVKQIGSISVSGSATLFTILTLSSDQGTIYPLSCGSFNRVFMFANTNGVYAVLGSSVQKISDDMDGIFKLIDFSQQPQAAVIDINNIHNIAWLVRYIDPLSTTRSIMLIFNGKKWWVANQGDSVATIVATSTLASGKVITYSSSGSDLTPMFGNPLVPVTFKAQTALTHHGNAVQRKKVNHAGLAVTGSSSGNLTVTVDTDNGVRTYTPAIVSGFQFIGFSADGSGEYLGLTVTGTLAGFTFTNTAQDYQEISRPFAK